MSQKRSIGPVTGASAVGGSLGAAIGQLIVHFFPTLGPVETAVTVIITAILAVVGGYLVPPKDDDIRVDQIKDGSLDVSKLD